MESKLLKIDEINSSSIVPDSSVKNCLDEITLLQREIIQSINTFDCKDLRVMRDRVIAFKGVLAVLYYLGLIDFGKYDKMTKITKKLLEKIHNRRMKINGSK